MTGVHTLSLTHTRTQIQAHTVCLLINQNAYQRQATTKTRSKQYIEAASRICSV